MNGALPRPRDERDATSDPAGVAPTLDATGSVTPDPFLAEVGRIPERASVPVAEALLRPGEEIGHFVVLSELGRGGMGVVYAAQDRSLGRTVALKVLPTSGDEERRRRFLREARAAAAISHPGIATIFEVGEVAGRVFIAMELVRGATLRARLDSGALPVPEALRIARAIARALEQAHARGVVHRDLKPENVMIAEDGHIKLLDFGLAKPLNSGDSGLGTATTATEDGRILGTPSYMSPEQAKGRPVDARSDVFSFGVMLYELLIGRRPFSGATVVEIFIALDRDEPAPPARVNPQVTAEVERVVLRCLRKDPAARYLDAGALVRDLEPAAAPLSAPPPPLRRPRPWARVFVAGMAVIGAALVAFGVHRHNARSATAPTALTDRPAPRAGKPEALAAYREGLTTLREGGNYEDPFLHALEIDPDLAEAHLELAVQWSSHMSDDAREHYRKAYALRDRLSDRDRALLDAIEPLLQRQPADWAESNRRLQVAVDRFPGDAELWHTLAWGRANFDDFEAAVRDEKKAIELDPRYACAYHTVAVELAYLGREGEAFRAIDQCLAEVPGALACMSEATKLHAENGECDAMESMARRMITAGAPTRVAYNTLAEALAAQRRPIATVREALRQSEQGLAEIPLSRMSETKRKQVMIGDQARLALLEGDFEAVEKLAGEFAPTVESSRQQSEHGQLARSIAHIYAEMGRDKDAARVAVDFLERRDAWEPTPSAEDSAMASDATPFLLLVAARAGAITRDDFVARREAWRRGWTARMTPVTKNFLWLHGYAGIADTAEDAREAIDALPRYTPVPPFHPESLVDARVGRMYFVGGRQDEAIPWLERAAKNCYLTRYPFESVHAHLWLGQAREAKGDTKGACSAYGEVVARWGHAKPRSVTADAARARMDALRCAG